MANATRTKYNLGELMEESMDRVQPQASRAKIAVAVSGRGRTLDNLASYSQTSFSNFTVAAVISSNPRCQALSLKSARDLPQFIASFHPERHNEETPKLLDFLTKEGIDWVVLGGFLKPFPIMQPYRKRVINIHPALLPAHGGFGMYGIRVHRSVLAAGELKSGASVHYVTEKYDEGDVIAQAATEVLKSDTPETLSERVFNLETKLLPDVLVDLIDGRLPLPNKKTAVYHYSLR